MNSIVFCLLLLVVGVVSKTVKMTIHKRDDKEFVQNIVRAAKNGIKTSHSVSDDGSWSSRLPELTILRRDYPVGVAASLFERRMASVQGLDPQEFSLRSIR